jgi:ubiquinone biosynthesis protein
VVKAWMEEQIGPRARLNEAAQGVSALAGLVAEAPRLAEQARRMSAAFAEAGENGLHLDNATVDRMAAAQSARAWPARAALWLGALALAAIAVKLWV